MTRVLGLDPGSLRLGWGIVQIDGGRLGHVAHGTIRAPRSQGLSARLALLYTELSGLLDRYAPSTVGIEKVFSHRNARAALTLGHARGIVLLALGLRGLEISEYSPSEIKLAVAGHGHSSKQQLAVMVSRILGIALGPEDPDSSDALAIAVCHAEARRRRRLLRRLGEEGHGRSDLREDR